MHTRTESESENWWKSIMSWMCGMRCGSLELKYFHSSIQLQSSIRQNSINFRRCFSTERNDLSS